jgi:hypothetical protein
VFCGDLKKHAHWKTDYEATAPGFVMAVVNQFPVLTKEFNKAIVSYECSKVTFSIINEEEV